MIRRKLVLVLGAGASMPFGFPSGKGLKDSITRQLADQSASEMYQDLHIAGFEHQHIRAFGLALKKSGKQSVDAFLEHRTEFLDVGKAAIARHLMPIENENALFAEIRGNWYECFFGKLNARFDEFDKNSVSVLTFNYDRSLEHYLFTALHNAYGKSTTECAERLRSLPLVHLHGQLGELPYFAGSGGVEFGAKPTPESIRKCADAIKIIHEDVSDSSQFQYAHELLEMAERIFFLGFGYDQVNIQRLMSGLTNRKQQLSGSTVGVTQRECELTERQFRTLGFQTSSLSAYDLRDSIDFLRAFCPFDWD